MWGRGGSRDVSLGCSSETRKHDGKEVFTIYVDKGGNALTLLLNKLNPWS